MKSNDELPTYSAQACPLCRLHQPGKCDDCGLSLPKLPEMGTSGYQSCTTDHLHFSVNHPGIRNPAFRKLCPNCYIKDFKIKYPNEPCPVTAQSL